MAKSSIITMASALWLLSLVGLARCESLSVEGRIYCDTCRAQFVTKVSTYIKGAHVRLECREREGGIATYSKDAVTGEGGAYKIPVEGDHEDEICEVQLVKSSVPDCSEISKEPFTKLSARISLTTNNGMATPVRLANPIGFLRKATLPECPDVLREMGLTPDGLPA